MPDEQPDDAKREDARRDQAKRGDPERDDATRRPGRREPDRRPPERDGDGAAGEQLTRWVAQFDQFDATVERARLTGLAAADAAGEHADRALDQQRRAQAAADAAGGAAQQAEAAAQEAQRHRSTAEAAYKELLTIVDAIAAARKAFETAVERRDPNAAQAAVLAADEATDAVTDAVDPITAARDAAAKAADRATAAAARAEELAKDAAQDASDMRRRFEEWAKHLELQVAAARDHPATALADVEATDAAAKRAADAAQRAASARPSNAVVEREAVAASDAAARARAALDQARAALVELRKHVEALAEARKDFAAAVEQRDQERARAALDAAERAADQVGDALDPIAEARKQAAAAADDAREAAERADAAAAKQDDEHQHGEAQQQADANRVAVSGARRDADAIAERLTRLVDEAEERSAITAKIESLLAKGERCAERAARSAVQGPIARAALAEAAEQAEQAAEVRREIDTVLAQLADVSADAREAATKATEIHRTAPGDRSVLELAEFVAERRREFERLVAKLEALVERLRAHLQAIHDAIEAACAAARQARLEAPRPTGGEGVLYPPQPHPVPEAEPPDPATAPDPDEAVALAGEVPLLLVPVRIETRFGQPAEKTTPLRIRIYPDRFSVATDRALPTPAEVQLARTYWESHLGASGSASGSQSDTEPDIAAEQDAAWSWLVDQLDIHRAGHVARLTKPTVRNGNLDWPDVETTDVDPAAEATNLPHRFVAIGWSNGAEVFRARGAVLDDQPYHTSPDPLADAAERTDLGITTTEHMRWIVDYDNAVERGMAITVDVEHAWGTIDTLIVVGIERRKDSGTAEALAALIDTHSISQGFAFVPQGTPTNNTDTVDAGWTRQQREREVVAEQRRVDLTGKLDIAKGSNAARFARALGLSDTAQLARQPFALDREWRRGAAMRAGLYDVVIGRYLDELLPTPGTTLLSDAAHGAFRDWFVDHVTGGAAVPTIRVGPQPYAVLPVLRPGHSDVRPTIGHRVARIVARLEDEWLRTLDDGVARLDHNVGEDPDAVRGNIAEVLATEPHPADLFMRRLDLHERTTSQFDRTGLLLPSFQLGQLTPSGQIVWIEVDNGFIGEFEIDLEHIENTAPDLWAELVAMRSELGAPQTVEDQIVLWSKFRQLVDAITRNPWGESAEASVSIRGQLRAAADVLQEVNDVVAGLIAHEQRQRPLSTLNIPGFNGVLSEDNPPLIVSKFAATNEPVARALVGDDAFAPADYVGPAVRGETIDAFDRAPLLAQLLSAAATSRKLPNPLRDQTIGALSEATDEELEWTLRETLGLGIHRLDAWHIAFANQELEAVRSRRPEGLYVGSYGWVTDLDIPEQRVERVSRGFLHAPSLGHAVTASVVRSGWQARGDADGRSPGAIDLRSNRYRYAMWLIEGVRAGQSIGDLLGYEFERLCHDLDIDEQIARIRRLVGEAHERADGIEDPVDGIELMELFASGGVDAHLAAVGSEFGPAREDTLRLLLEGLAWSFDAIDDALLAESTHHLLAGNLERAAASIEAGSGGATPPPMPIGMNSMRPVRTVNHKVLLLADATPVGTSDWGTGVRDLISPAFETLAASLLPRPGDVAMTVVDTDGVVHLHALADLGLSALDAVYLASDDPTTIDAPLAAVVRLDTGIDGDVDTSLDPGGIGITLEEFQIVAASVRRMLSEGRLASGEDLDPALMGASVSNEQLTDVDAALGALTEDLAGATGSIDHGRRRRLAITGITGGDEQIGLVAARRLEAAQALGPATARDIVGAAFGRPFPVAAPISIAGTGASFDPSLADHAAVMAWLDDVALVRSDVDRLVTTMNLGAMVGVAGLLTAGTSQSPRHTGDEWAATGLPVDGTGGRNVVTAVWPGGSTAPPAQVIALVLDQWSEQIPGNSTVTGVAMHYDAPSQRPPQAMVLGVPETDEPWTLDGAIALLLDAMKWMQLRAVAPEDLGDYGHTIPTVFSDAVLHVDGLPDVEEDAP